MIHALSAPPKPNPAFKAKRIPAYIKPIALREVFHSEKSATSAIISQSRGTVGPHPTDQRTLSQKSKLMEVGVAQNTHAVAMVVTATPAIKTVFLPKRSASDLENMIPTIWTTLPITKNKLNPTAAALEPSGNTRKPKASNTEFHVPEVTPANPNCPRNSWIFV